MEMGCDKTARSITTKIAEAIKEVQEETSFEREAVKIEKETTDAKENIHIYYDKDRNVSVHEKTENGQNAAEMQQRIRLLELDLAKIKAEMKMSELEKFELKKELATTRVQLEEKMKHSNELELKQKSLDEKLESAEEQIREYEHMYFSQSEVLQAALRSQDTLQKELSDAKDATNKLTAVLEIYWQKTQRLEQEVKSSNAEPQKALELHNLLGLTTMNAKEMENQINALQKETDELYGQISANQQAESTPISELSIVQNQLKLLKMQEAELEQQIISREGVISQVEGQLNITKEPEERSKGDILALENLLIACKKDLQSKTTELKELNPKLMDERKKTIQLEDNLKNQEARFLIIEEELSNMTKMKDDAEATVSSLNHEIHHLQQLVLDLETKLKFYTNKSAESEPHLEQALSHFSELEQKLHSLHILHDESEIRAGDAINLNIEYEKKLQVSNAAREAAESKFRINEQEATHKRQKDLDCGEQLNLPTLCSSETDRSVKEFQEDSFELSKSLQQVKEEKEHLETQIREYKDMIVSLEFSLSQSSQRNSELEKGVKGMAERLAEHENKATATHQRFLEMEHLIQASHSKAEDARRKVRELELQLSNSEQKKKDLEEHCRSIETKYVEVKNESKQYSDILSKISSELEASITEVSNLEVSSQSAKKQETELMENLRKLLEERNRLLDEISHTELVLGRSNLKVKDLESNLITAMEKCEEHEHHANITHQQSLELEELSDMSQSRADVAEKKVAELEVLLKSSKEKERESEVHIRTIEEKLLDAKKECEGYTSKVSKLSQDLEVSLEKVSKLELAQQNQNMKETKLEEQLALVIAEKEILENKIDQVESDLSWSTLRNLDLEQELKVTKEKCSYCESRANINHQRSLELEGLIQVANSKAEDAEARHEKCASKLSKLSEDLEISHAKGSSLQSAVQDAKREERELRDHLALVIEEREKFEDKIKHLESDLDHSSFKKLDLEQELKIVKKKLSEQENLANMNQQHCLELEYQLQLSNSKSMDQEKEIAELNLLLENSMEKQNELVEHFRSTKTRSMEMESEFKQCSKKLAEISTELEASSAKALNFEVALQDAEEKEKELTESVKKVVEERNKLSSEINHLQSALHQSKLKTDELETDLVVTMEKCVEHECHANLMRQQSLKLEDLIQISHSKEQHEEQKVIELEKLLRNSKEREREFEEQVRSMDIAFLDAKKECERYANKVSKLSQDLEASLEKVSILELAQHDAGIKEEGLKEDLALVDAEKENFEKKIKKLESDLDKSTLRNLELEQDLEVISEKCSEYEGLANANEKRCLELEGLIQIANSKTEAAEAKHETYASKVSELSSNLEASVAKASSLERSLHDANTKENDLKEYLALVVAEHGNFEDKIKQFEFELSQSTLRKLELEQELEATRKRCKEQDTANRNEQRCIEIEHQVQMSNMKAEAGKRECEKYATQVSKLSEDLQDRLKKISFLESALRNANEKENDLKENLHLDMLERKRFEAKVMQLQSELDDLTARNSDLEQKFKVVTVKCTEHEGRTSLIRQKSLHLEDLVQISQSKAQDAVRKVGHLELLLKESVQKNRELEEELSSARAECKQYADKLSETSLELEASLVNASALEIALVDANETKVDLQQKIHFITKEKEKLEDATNDSNAKLSQMENLLELLQHELRTTQQKLVTVEKAVEGAAKKEIELLMKLEVSEEQLSKQRFIIEQSTTKCQLLESQFAEADLKLQEATEKIALRDSEAKDLMDKLNVLEKQVADYQEEAMEASAGSKTLEAQLEEHLAKLVSLEEVCDALKSKVSEGENKAKMSASENEVLVGTTMKLKDELRTYHGKICELEQMLQALQTEKEAMMEEIEFRKKSVNELNDRHAKTLELYSAAESRTLEAEQKLYEAIERHKLRDSDAKELYENLEVIESQLRIYQEQAADAEEIIENQRTQMEETLSKLVHLESFVKELQSSYSKLKDENDALAETNTKLTQELTSNQTQMSILQESLTSSQAEANDIVRQLDECKKAIAELREQHEVGRKKLESQLSSAMSENHALNEMYQNALKELEAVKSELEDELNEGKTREVNLCADIENLRAEVAEKSTLLSRIEDLELELELSENKFKEQMEIGSWSDLERESSLKNALAELEAKDHQASVLEKQIEEYRGQLDRSTSSLEPKVKGRTEEKPKRKGKRKAEEATQAVEASPLLGLKLILVVVSVSLIVGVLLGKRV
ncbi:uncharacterized protein LOC116267666 [Nymphaea colorata]|uniref:uncharacterized protein LOC116267666 n=1 Tax=Nymphaea colorata TaxID=210225 RepID=UPI00129D7433|nr:uncharacterized protein LOC116267666 [Nymphaea colorata]